VNFILLKRLTSLNALVAFAVIFCIPIAKHTLVVCDIRLKIWKILVGLNSHTLAEAAQRLLKRAMSLVLKLEELAVLNAGCADGKTKITGGMKIVESKIKTSGFPNFAKQQFLFRMLVTRKYLKLFCSNKKETKGTIEKNIFMNEYQFPTLARAAIIAFSTRNECAAASLRSWTLACTFGARGVDSSTTARIASCICRFCSLRRQISSSFSCQGC
jgi:hypothetical protein